MTEGEEKGEGFQLDVAVAAIGFSKKDQQTLEEVDWRLATSFPKTVPQ